MRKTINKKGQSTLEYAVLVVVIIGALIAMQIYVKRGVQGKLRESTDSVGEQFSPGYTQYSKNSTSYSRTNETQSNTSTGTNIIMQNQARNMMENVLNTSNEYWKN